MIAINIPRRQIHFIKGLTQNEKKHLLEQVWKYKIFKYFIFPLYEEKEIRDLLYFEKDMSYLL